MPAEEGRPGLDRLPYARVREFLTPPLCSSHWLPWIRGDLSEPVNQCADVKTQQALHSRDGHARNIPRSVRVRA